MVNTPTKMECRECKMMQIFQLPSVYISPEDLICDSCSSTERKFHDFESTNENFVPYEICSIEEHLHSCQTDFRFTAINHISIINTIFSELEKYLTDSEMNEKEALLDVIAKMKREEERFRNIIYAPIQKPRKIFKYFDPSKFIKEILDHIKAEYKVYYYIFCGGETKYGEVTVKEKTIYFHSMCSSDELEKKAILISLDYVYDNFDSKFEIFFELKNAENGKVKNLRIAPLYTSLRKQFIERCLGIIFASRCYKNECIVEGNMSFDSYDKMMWFSLPEEVPSLCRHYYIYHKGFACCETGKYYVTGNFNGEFSIIHSVIDESAKVLKAIGQVLSDMIYVLNKFNKLQIIDCGIQFELEDV